MLARLELSAAHFSVGGESRRKADFSLRSGQWALLYEPYPAALPYWLDILTGLQPPLQGRVHFDGICWTQRSWQQQLAARHKIGCISNEDAWIAQKPILESILLSVQPMGRKDTQRWIERAELLAREFLLPGLPVDVPASLSSADRLRATCIKALLVQPSLLVIAEDTSGDWNLLLSALTRRIQTHCLAGGSVLWLTTTAQRFADRKLQPDYRLAVTDNHSILPVDHQVMEPHR